MDTSAYKKIGSYKKAQQLNVHTYIGRLQNIASLKLFFIFSNHCKVRGYLDTQFLSILREIFLHFQ
jgi:hypothetical protein